MDRFIIRSPSGQPVRSKVVSIQIAQIGNDKRAQAYLQKLDTDPDVGTLIDCTSSKFFITDFQRLRNPPLT